MKVALVIVALVAVSTALPQPRKVFHEHLEDFLDVIIEEAGDELEHILSHYIDNEEFIATIEYIKNSSFRDLVYEMESLPEFKAVIEFLENDNIDIIYFLDRFNEVIDDIQRRRSGRNEVSGKDFNSYINDVINALPKEKLAALFEQKKSEDEEFKLAMENLQTDEWDQVFSALWANEVFQKEVQTLTENGIDVYLLLTEIKAIFGQN